MTVNEHVGMQDTAQKVARTWPVTPCASGNRNHHELLKVHLPEMQKVLMSQRALLSY